MDDLVGLVAAIAFAATAAAAAEFFEWKSGRFAPLRGLARRPSVVHHADKLKNGPKSQEFRCENEHKLVRVV